MPVEIGTNISYRGKKYLDQRQEVNSKDDLLSWSTPVPEGFEVFCEGKWYTYISSHSNSETGHFIQRIDNDIQDSEVQETIESIQDDIERIENVVYPLELRDLSHNGGLYDVDAEVVPQIRYKLFWKGEDYGLNPAIVVDSSLPGRNVMGTIRSFTADKKLTPGITTLKMKIKLGNTPVETSLDIFYNLCPRKYLILTYSPDLINEEEEEITLLDAEEGVIENKTILDSPFAGFDTQEEYKTKSPIDHEATVDCTEYSGGRYIHYLVPKELLQNENKLKVYANGMRFTDYTITELPGYIQDIDYLDIKFNRVYHGVLDIKFKEE